MLMALFFYIKYMVISNNFITLYSNLGIELKLENKIMKIPKINKYILSKYLLCANLLEYL